MLDGARFVQRLWVRKNFLFPSLTLFLNMLVGRKLFPPCLVFLNVHFITLMIVNMLRKNFIMFLKVGKVFWIGLSKVWHMKVWRKSFNLPQFSTYLKRKAHVWIWKHDKLVVIPSSGKLSIEMLIIQVSCPYMHMSSKIGFKVQSCILRKGDWRGDSRNLITIIIQTFFIVNGLTSGSLSFKFICFGVSGVIFFKVPRLKLHGKFN
jgi:hypothetical protein